jgi:PIN domain nuclease of toxin-antitoxin system
MFPAVAMAAGRISREVLADPRDRVLVATAHEIEATLLTADERILGYGARTRVLRTEDAAR